MLNKEKIAFPIKISQVTQETPDSISISLSIPKELEGTFQYRPGQFISLFVEVGGQELTRSYSLCTAPNGELNMKIAVKKIPGGRVSTYLVDKIKAGDTLWCTPPAGHFFQTNPEVANYLLVGAGSGITPLLSILKYVLSKSDKNRVTLIFCNRHHHDIIFAQELSQIQAQFAENFHLTHILSHPPENWKGIGGRLNPSLVKDIFLRLKRSSSMPIEAYLCGPADFMQMCQETLLQNGLDALNIHWENFGVASSGANPSPIAQTESLGQSEEGLQDDGSLVLGAPLKAPDEPPEVIEAEIDGEIVTVKAIRDLNILETLMNEGHNPPYSCMSGACMACMARIEEGRAIQDDPGILTEENFQHREILTCQARPLSQKLKITFCN